MKKDRRRYSPGRVYRAQLWINSDNSVNSSRSTVHPVRQYSVTATPVTKFDCVTRWGGKPPSSNRTNDKATGTAMSFIMTDREKAHLVQKGASILRKVVGDGHQKVPPGYDSAGFVVQQISTRHQDSVQRSYSTGTSIGLPVHRGWRAQSQGHNQKVTDRRPRNVDLFDVNHENEVPQNSIKVQKSVHFATDLPRMKIPHCSGIVYGHTPQGLVRDVKSCTGCKAHRPEMVLPKIDMSSAMDDGVLATVHTILNNTPSVSRQHWSHRDKVIMALLSTRELKGKRPSEAKKSSRSFQTRKSQPGQKNPPRHNTPTSKQLIPDFPAPKKPEHNVTLTEALMNGGLLSAVHGGSGDKKPPPVKCETSNTNTVRQSIKLTTFQMALPV